MSEKKRANLGRIGKKNPGFQLAKLDWDQLDLNEKGNLRKHAKQLNEALHDWAQFSIPARKRFLTRIKSLAEYNPKQARYWMAVYNLMIIAHKINPIEVPDKEPKGQ